MSYPAAPHELILDLWVKGTSRAAIIKAIRRPNGQPYSYVLIDRTIRLARRAKDPRAIYRRAPTGRGIYITAPIC